MLDSAFFSSYPLVTDAHEIERLHIQAAFWRNDAAIALDRMGVPLGGRCLDVCCGPGGITDLLSERVGINGEVIGLDNDPPKN